jgi:hypothetical protein
LFFAYPIEEVLLYLSMDQESRSQIEPALLLFFASLKSCLGSNSVIMLEVQLQRTPPLFPEEAWSPGRVLLPFDSEISILRVAPE